MDLYRHNIFKDSYAEVYSKLSEKESVNILFCLTDSMYQSLESILLLFHQFTQDFWAVSSFASTELSGAQKLYCVCKELPECIG